MKNRKTIQHLKFISKELQILCDDNTLLSGEIKKYFKEYIERLKE